MIPIKDNCKYIVNYFVMKMHWNTRRRLLSFVRNEYIFNIEWMDDMPNILTLADDYLYKHL